MNLNKIIQNLFPNTEYTLEKTDLGLTNINYILTTPTQKYMIRLPYSDELKIVDFQHEYEAIKLTRDYNLDVPIFYYDKKTGIKITYYIEDTYTYQTCPFTDKIERVAHLMKKLHSINKTSPYDFNPLIRYEQYKQQIKNPIYDLSFAEGIIDKIKKIAASTTLCHNDWVDGNILFAENKTYLIDYEYAGNNDPLFDVMSFLTENNINDNILRNRFYSIYFDSLDETTKNKLDLWEAFHHLLWCNWAMMMYESRSKSIYKEIAKEKYLSLEEKNTYFETYGGIMNYSIEELKNALQLVSSTIIQCEKMKIKFKEGTSQSTLLKNRLKALYIAKYLIEEQINKNNPTKTWNIEELEFALIPLQSILNKSSKAFQHTKEGSSTFTRLNKIMNAMNISITLINDKL